MFIRKTHLSSTMKERVPRSISRSMRIVSGTWIKNISILLFLTISINIILLLVSIVIMIYRRKGGGGIGVASQFGAVVVSLEL